MHTTPSAFGLRLIMWFSLLICPLKISRSSLTTELMRQHSYSRLRLFLSTFQEVATFFSVRRDAMFSFVYLLPPPSRVYRFRKFSRDPILTLNQICEKSSKVPQWFYGVKNATLSPFILLHIARLPYGESSPVISSSRMTLRQELETEVIQLQSRLVPRLRRLPEYLEDARRFAGRQ